MGYLAKILNLCMSVKMANVQFASLNLFGAAESSLRMLITVTAPALCAEFFAEVATLQLDIFKRVEN